MDNWTLRDISREAAAAALNMPPETLATWTSRYKAPSGKRRGSRLFSLQDLVIIETARSLLGPRCLAVDAIALVTPLLDDPPAPGRDLFFVSGRAYLAGDDHWPDDSFTRLNLNTILKIITRRLNVALHE